MLPPGIGPLDVGLHTRRIGDPQLTRQLIQDHRRHVQRIIQERAQEPHRRQPQRKPKTTRIAPTLRDELPVLVIEEEEPLKLLTRRRAVETATRRQLLRG